MSRLLFGWELGANLGHAKPLARIARELPPDDFEIFVAARDLGCARIAFEANASRILQAPVWPPHRHFGSQAGQGGYLDILVEIGFADPAKLASMVEGWLALLALVQPDAVIADHSPALLLASWLRKLPVIQVGTAFTVPPVAFERFPPVRADRASIMPESRVLEAVARVSTALGEAPPANLLEIFRTNVRIATGCPELDPYFSFRREPLYLPPESLPEFSEPPVEPRVFAYLGPELPRIDEFVQALAELGVPIEIYLRGELPALSQFLAMAGHQVHERPPALADLLPKVSHVISAGGAFTCHAALAAGRPMLAMPLHGESNLNVVALERLGAGRRLDGWGDARSLNKILSAFVRDHRLLRQARHWAKILAARTQPDGLAAAVNGVREAIRQAATK